VITVWVFGDQLNINIGALATAQPDTHRVLLIESVEKIRSRPWHPQRVHLYVSAMRHFAVELRAAGFEVDYRHATSMRRGVTEHRSEWSPSRVIATEPNSYRARQLCVELDVETVRSNQFLCHPDEFAGFVGSRKSLKMEDFYRWQRRRLGYLMDGTEPVAGRWNFDDENREPPPKTGHDRWPSPPVSSFDEIDREVLHTLPADVFGARPTGQWATTRADALARLQFFVENVLPMFGPHEDAMLKDNWHLAHSLLSPYLNLGLLLPHEVADAAHDAFRNGHVPISSAEGFIRQVIGWREFIWNMYWKLMPEYVEMNGLHATLALPPVFAGQAETQMNCVSHSLRAIHDYGWAHHIQRLMVLGNFALISGIQPREFTDWMWESFVDAAEWVMVPNVVGMSLYADGGQLATKPYASGGAYIDRMSDYCADCVYDRKKRVGDNACPFTTLYWDFMLRHEEQFVRNPRVSRQVYAARKLSDVDAVQDRAQQALHLLSNGDL
jgi:deoxyribodipyrimidine photolyase-related protein